MKRGWMLLLVLVAVFGFSGGVNALTVIGTANYGGNDYNLIYEEGNNGKNLIWLDYSNFSPKDWASQLAWAQNLNGTLSYNLNPGVNVTWNGVWRLPIAMDGNYAWGENGISNTAGFNITSSELGYLYQNSLGNQSGWDSYQSLLNNGPFENLYEFSYWTGTEYAAYDSMAWRYTFDVGALERIYKAETWPFALAVRQGDVNAVNSVPEPSTAMLLLSGLVGVVGVKRKVKKI